MILASAIALLLMWGLYVGMDVQLRLTDEGRTVVNQADLARNLLTRMSADLTGCLTPITAAKATSLGGSTGSTGTSTSSGDGTAPTPFNMGLQGDANQVTVWVSAVPKVNVDPGGDRASAEQQQSASDIRRITYWLASNGLARQEVTRVTGNDDDTALPPNVSDESKFIYAEDVTAVSFQYFDGTSWTDTWDGSTLGADGKTPIGPPRLIQITLTIRYAGTQGGEATEKTFIHCVAIGAANAQPTSAGATPAGSTSSSGTGTTGGSP